MKLFQNTTLALLTAWVVSSPAIANNGKFDFRPEVAVELRYFPESPMYAEQFSSTQAASILTGDGRWQSKDRKTRILFEPYLRVDSQDDARTYADLRELSYSTEFDSFDLLFGVSQVFWGVAESRNVVDVINQFDTIEDIDEGEKLGQPMIRLSKRMDIGNFDLYYLPFFREREFARANGRLRTAFVVNTDLASYERDDDEYAGDYAFRFNQRYGDFDVGLHTFYGTNRSPMLLPSSELTDGASFENSTFSPYYQRLRQVGADVQYTNGSWLLKAELVSAKISDDSFFSSVVGFEYTLFDIRASGYDIGLLSEYLYDNRNPLVSPETPFNDDLFIATRIVANDIFDSELLAGVIVDTENGAYQGTIEYQRRIGDVFTLEIEAKFFKESGDRIIDSLSQDDLLMVRLSRFF